MFAEDHNTHVPYSSWPNGVPVRGTWHGGQKAGGKRTALVACPNCGKIASLSDHEIDNSGHVTPSVVCPQNSCEFHEMVVLDGWDPDGAEHGE